MSSRDIDLKVGIKERLKSKAEGEAGGVENYRIRLSVDVTRHNCLVLRRDLQKKKLDNFPPQQRSHG